MPSRRVAAARGVAAAGMMLGAVMGSAVVEVGLPTPVAAQTAQTGRIAVVTTTVDVPEGGVAPATILVGAAIPSIVVAVDSPVADVAPTSCTPVPTAFLPSTPLSGWPVNAPSRIDFCVRGLKAGTGKAVVIGSDGSSVSVTVRVKARTPTAAATVPSPPSKLQVVTGDAVRRSTVSPGFALSADQSAVAAGPDGAAVALLSTTRQQCPATREALATAVTSPTSSTTTTTTTAVSNAPVLLLVCNVNQVGKYEATFDLNGDEAGGTIAFTAVRRLTAWLALAAVLAGLLAGLVTTWVAGKAKAKEATSQVVRARAAAREIFADVGLELGFGGPDTSAFAGEWDPDIWESEFASSPQSTGESYADVASAVPHLMALWLHYRKGLGPEPDDSSEVALASSAHHDLRFGIQRFGDRDTATKIAGHLREHGVLAKVALDEEQRLAARMLTAPAAEKQRLQARRRSLAASTLDEVPGAFDAPEGTTDPAARLLDLQGTAAHTLGLRARASWIGALDRTAPVAATPISPTRAALQSGAARGVAVVLGLAVAALVGMVEALDSTSAWGTRADIVKMFGAAVLLPGLADQVRKVLAGPAPSGS